LLEAIIGSGYRLYLAISDFLRIFFCNRCHASFEDDLKGLREYVRFISKDSLSLLFDHAIPVAACKIKLLLL
jgi:hypothetical protein